MKETFYYELDGKKYEYHLKESVPFSDILSAINSAVDSCYMDDGSFHPELEDFYKEYVIISTLTDIEIPDDADSAYRIICAVDGVPSVDADFISDGIRKKIAYQKSLILASVKASGANRLADEIGGLLAKLNEIADKGINLINMMADEDEAGNMPDINKIVNALNKMNTTPEQLASVMIATNREERRAVSKTTKKTSK